MAGHLWVKLERTHLLTEGTACILFMYMCMCTCSLVFVAAPSSTHAHSVPHVNRQASTHGKHGFAWPYYIYM